MFVHLTPAVNEARVRRAGIKAVGRGGRGGGGRGVFCFPVLPSYTLTHQWLRELARREGPRGLVAVHGRLPDDERVSVGPYHGTPVELSASDAVRRVAALADPRGWEVFLPRAVSRQEVHRVRAVRQVTGWRYFPGAHGVTPCTCDGCRVRGEYGSRRLRERRPHPLDGPPPPIPVLLERIGAAAGEPGALCAALRWFRLRRRGPVEALAGLAAHPDADVRMALAEAVARWSTPGVDALLVGLAADPDPEVREVAGMIEETRSGGGGGDG